MRIFDGMASMARVLVIEDNPADLDLLSYLLQAGGHSVTQAHGGLEGIGAAVATRPDLILCDLRMPNVSGFDVVARLHDSPGLAETPVVAVTILGSPGNRRLMLDAGFSGFMPKPIDPPGFLAEIASYLNQAQRRSQY